MALDRTRKSVIFHKGISDDADRFLLEPPAIDYAENLRIDKEGSLQKRPGFGPSVLTSVPNVTGEPFFLEELAGDLITLDVNSLSSYEDGVGWRSTPLGGFLAQADLWLDTGRIAGAAHTDAAVQLSESVIGPAGHTVVMEVRERTIGDSVTEPTPTHVLIKQYNASGKLVNKLRIDDAHSPKVKSMGDVHLIVYFKFGQGLKVRRSFPFTRLILDEQDLGITPSLRNMLYSHGDLTDQPSRSGGRIGEGYDHSAKYQMDAYDDGFVIAWSKDEQANAIKVQTFDTLANKTFAEEVLFQSEIDESAEIFDVKYGSGLITHCVVASFDVLDATSARDTTAKIWYVPIGKYEPRNVSSPVLIRTLPDRTHINGAVCESEDDSDEVLIAWTDGGKSNWVDPAQSATQLNEHGGRTPDSGLRWRIFHLVDGLDSQQGYMFHHRLISDLVHRDGEYYSLVQQWYDATGYIRDSVMESVYDYTSILPALKPVTTSLVHLDTTIDYPSRVARPVAYVDAGSGLQAEPSEAMVNTHRAGLHKDGLDLWFSNRVAFSVPDMTMWLGDAGGTLAFRVIRSESPSDAGVRFYKASEATSINVEEMGDGLIAASALPLWLDGDSISELSPLDSPEIVNVMDAKWQDPETGLGFWVETAFDEIPNTDLEWRKFVVITGYTDNKGNVHRSAPSGTVYVARLDEDSVDGDDDPYAGEEVTVTFTAPSTIVPGQGSYFAELYVSNTVDDDPQLVGTRAIDTDSGLIEDYQLVVQLARVQPAKDPSYPIHRNTIQPRTSKGIYTSGGTLAVDPWPNFTLSVATSTRLWAIDAVSKGRVILSKLFEDFIGPEYNSTLTINLGDERRLTAIGKLDDKVIVFEPNHIHVIYGEGPDNRGQGQDFAVHYITTDVGCEDQESVIETPAGLIFYSKPRGFYLLDRNLQIQFIGGGVEDLARDIDVIAATLVPDRAEVRFVFTGGVSDLDIFGPSPDTIAVDRPPRPVFTTAAAENANPALSYNYEQNTWLLYTNYDAAAATIYQNKYTRLLNNWDIWQESGTRFDDPTGLNSTVMITPWIKLSEQVQGFNRLWKMTFLGRYMSSLQDMGNEEYEAGDVQVDVYFDYETTLAQTVRKRLQDFGYDPFNKIPLRAERFQFEISPKRGRCQAIKLVIKEIPTENMGEGLTYKQGHGFEIVSVDFDIGISPMRSLLPQKSKR